MKRVMIVGAGALGSHVLLFSRNFKDVVFDIIDFDRVEAKNVMSQFHTKMGLSKYKTVALQQSMLGLFGVKIQSTPTRLEQNNANVLLAGEDIIVDCTDNAATRRLIQTWCLENDVPCLHGALAANGGYGRVVWSENFVVDESATGGATCEDGEQLVFITLVANRIAQSLKAFLYENRRVGYEISPTQIFSP